MESLAQLRQCYVDIEKEAIQLAGATHQLSQRATTYHHLFEDSGHNHIFPLIAAHGALWARGYFAFGMKLGQVAAWQFAGNRDKRVAKLQALENFAEAFREVNRRVCVDTYATYHFTKHFGDHPDADQIVRAPLLAGLRQIHHARRSQTPLSDAARRQIFQAHFFDEQDRVVGPRIAQAVQEFDWPLMKSIALMPAVRFAYFPTGRWLQFWKFDNKAERIARGLKAFDIAAHVGWDQVERALDHYAILPDAFFADSVGHFAGMRTSVLSGC
ncbi:hypothetical protein AB1L30_06840 [Bremerella sp. JC817]|uniref:hypothetical protein n=1 Tax=Bremerella sp. JC817 TaxID=3231756 RepID=UPI003459EDA2